MTGKTSHITHTLAAEHAKRFISEALACGLTWTEINLACETIITIVMATTAAMSETPDKQRYAQEMIDLLTERTHERVRDYLNKKGE